MSRVPGKVFLFDILRLDIIVQRNILGNEVSVTIISLDKNGS
jgi:hypothetical protein